jgi:hypothetical protein
MTTQENKLSRLISKHAILACGEGQPWRRPGSSQPFLVADVAGYSKLAGADEEHTLARLWALRSDLIYPTIALHHGRVVKPTGDGVLIEFRGVVRGAAP